MHILTQLPSPVEAAEVASRLSEAGIVSILLFLILLLFSIGAGFGLLVYWKIFGRGNHPGVVDKAMAIHEEFLDRLTAAVEEAVITTKRNEETSRKIESSVNKLLEFMRRANVSYGDISKAYRSHVRISKSIVKRLGMLDEVEAHFIALEELMPEPQREESRQ